MILERLPDQSTKGVVRRPPQNSGKGSTSHSWRREAALQQLVVPQQAGFLLHGEDQIPLNKSRSRRLPQLASWGGNTTDCDPTTSQPCSRMLRSGHRPIQATVPMTPAFTLPGLLYQRIRHMSATQLPNITVRMFSAPVYGANDLSHDQPVPLGTRRSGIGIYGWQLLFG